MRWLRHRYQPCSPLGKDGRRVSGSVEHIELSRQAAAEGMVLLKNKNSILPLENGKRIVLLGKASEEYIKGGGGSGDVTVSYVRNFYDGLKIKESENKVQVYNGLHNFYADYVRRQHEEGKEPAMTVEPELSREQWVSAACFSDTAVICLCRFSGEGWDRRCALEKEFSMDGCETWEGEDALRKMGRQVFPKGDFYLSEEEENLIRTSEKYFKHRIILLNIGGIMDSSWFYEDDSIEAVLLAWQGGMEGGLAAADILCADVNPSGKLTDTFAKRLEDYPSTEGFHDSSFYVEYKEDIYVGYRYFETIPGKRERVNYPFGYGLSYTKFDIRVLQEEILQDRFICYVSVKNTGSISGKEVIQLYYSAPAGRLGKPAKELAAFEKTKLLMPCKEEVVKLEFPLEQMASYDDTGKICKSAYIMEKGQYHFYIGTSVEDVEELKTVYYLKEDWVTERLAERLKPRKLSKRMLADGSYETLECSEYEEIKRPAVFEHPSELEGIAPEVRYEKRQTLQERFYPKYKELADVAQGGISMEEFIEGLNTEELVWLLGGQPCTGVANTFGIGNNKKHGIPSVMTADGPAGLRILPECGIYTTAWPCATMLACTWNRELVRKVGAAGAKEVKENNIGIWLTPGMNIHRSPLWGRNFEYYSEDPVVAGEIGAAMVQGIQSQNIAATPKHFAANNKETNRKHSDSRLSERAAREIYLKGFEIVVKKADPWMIMTSYNMINGTYASENKELLSDILRGEWGFHGTVTTDWWTRAEHYREVKAGNDIKMANGYPEQLLENLEQGRLNILEVKQCAKRVLELILKLE